MRESRNFFVEAWEKIRPNALAQFVDLGGYLILWTGVFGAHLVKLGAAAIGIDSEFILVISFMERWVLVATFAAFFVSGLFRIIVGMRGLRWN
jgi:hypothetical protein